MAHTPKLWTCSDETERIFAGSGDYLVMTNDAHFHVVAAIPVPIHNIPWSTQEAQAHARLIAAAPELLEALQHVLLETDDNSTTFHISGTLWQKIDAAIAKATGAP